MEENMFKKKLVNAKVASYKGFEVGLSVQVYQSIQETDNQGVKNGEVEGT